MKYLIIIPFIFLSVCFAQAQTNKSKPAPKTQVNELAAIMTGIGLPYKIVNDSLAAVPYTGEHIKNYNVIIQKISDLYIVYSDLTEILPGKIDETKYKYLLQQNDQFDVVKITMSSDGDTKYYVRADLFKAAVNTSILKSVIVQVANVTNIIAGDIQ